MTDAPKQDIKPAFFVQPLAGSFTRQVRKYTKVNEGDKVRNVLTIENRTNDGGFMVFHPRGHSIFIKDAKRLSELRLNTAPPLVDMTSGDVVGVLGIPLALSDVKKSDEQAMTGGK